jgi:phospholipid transport system substrate-binding protein
MRYFWCVAALLFAAAQCAFAAADDPNDPNELLKARPEFRVKDSNDPNELLMNGWNAAVNVLRAQDINRTLKEKVIEKQVSPLFDFPLMAKLTLGREHWPKLDTRQAERFTQLFTRRLKDSYCGKIMLYEDEKASLQPAVRSGRTLRIPMQMISEEKTIDILYKLRKDDERWKIYDVEIEGVSILLTYRSQFDDILRDGTVSDLLGRLEAPEPLKDSAGPQR